MIKISDTLWVRKIENIEFNKKESLRYRSDLNGDYATHINMFDVFVNSLLAFSSEKEEESREFLDDLLKKIETK